MSGLIAHHLLFWAGVFSCLSGKAFADRRYAFGACFFGMSTGLILMAVGLHDQ